MKSEDLSFMALWSSLKIIIILLLICVVLLLAIFFNTTPSSAQNSSPLAPDNPTELKKEEIVLTEKQSKGKELFEGNCATCHAIDKVKVGPALSGVSKRRPIDWIIKFVHNSQKVIQSGDPYAKELYAQYNNTDMTAFTSLSDDEIKSIISYVENSDLQ